MKTFLHHLVILGSVACAIEQSLAAPGNIDTTFGSSGKVTFAINGGSRAECTAVQSDGKIIVGGSSFPGTSEQFTLARLDSLGSLDPTFGQGGIVGTSVGRSGGRCYSIAVQTDGKIVAGGYANLSSATAGTLYAFVVVRFLSSGLLDSSFGNGGIVTTAPQGKMINVCQSLLVESDGKILVGGISRSSYYDSHFALLRYTSTGELDQSFGTSGIVITEFGNVDWGASIALQSDGKIIMAGSTLNAGTYDIAVARYTSSGGLDPSFGNAGKIVTSIGTGDDSGNCVLVQSDGKILVAGNSANGNQGNVAVVRYTDAGTLDTSFGTNGVARSAITTSGSKALIQRDGKIVIAGGSFNGSNYDFSVVRFFANGLLDTGFGNQGATTTSIRDDDDEALGIALQGDGKVVMAGYSANSGVQQIALARYDNSLAPTVQTLSATGIGDDSATINGLVDSNVNAGGDTTTASFDWGTSGGYGSSIAGTPPTVTGSTAMSVSANITGLTPGTTYHFRVNGTSSVGTTNGSDATFTTLTNYQVWRQTYYGTTDNSGNAADMADVDHDGQPNLIEFAINSTPLAFSSSPGTLVLNGASLEFTYTRSKGAMADGFTFTVEWSDSLTTASWSSAGVTESILSDNGTVQQVQAVLPAGGSGRRFVHLKVSGP
jgi:uncharacterized delta-60 repeat protein